VCPAAPPTVTAGLCLVLSCSIHYGFSITTDFIILIKIVVVKTQKVAKAKQLSALTNSLASEA
jgi:hypothetical protein